VRGSLEQAASVPERSVQVAVSNGWVALDGRVECLREREEAERIARRTAGVRGVYNLIDLSPPAHKFDNARDAVAARGAAHYAGHPPTHNRT
jgi:hypothetical protein